MGWANSSAKVMEPGYFGSLVCYRTDCYRGASYLVCMINANTPYCPPQAWDTPLTGRAEPAQVANVKRAVPVRSVGRRSASTSYRYASDKQCPLCGGRLIRTPRRLQDRLWSMVEPAMRFRCDRFSCQWVGNISGRGSAKSQARGAVSRLLSRATLVALLFAGVGVVVLALLAGTDVFESAAVRRTAMPSSEWEDLTRRLNAGSGALSEPVQLNSAQPVVPQVRR